ncbi:BON domain protein [Rubripirellula tenax]|uniref:BON domain protein n=1 Tax=Rubripirellula tenax TaxID=2528015 RepID=A0A5C6FDY1_9BACT|nr:BON domain-containing protein [Rubripirellula tenax]TWU60016.1 BON domain protein [Rubripirellula tenax]
MNKNEHALSIVERVQQGLDRMGMSHIEAVAPIDQVDDQASEVSETGGRDVRLTGDSKHPDDKAMALAIARVTPGVKSVVNEIRAVRPVRDIKKS